MVWRTGLKAPEFCTRPGQKGKMPEPLLQKSLQRCLTLHDNKSRIYLSLA